MMDGYCLMKKGGLLPGGTAHKSRLGRGKRSEGFGCKGTWPSFIALSKGICFDHTLYLCPDPGCNFHCQLWKLFLPSSEVLLQQGARIFAHHTATWGRQGEETYSDMQAEKKQDILYHSGEVLGRFRKGHFTQLLCQAGSTVDNSRQREAKGTSLLTYGCLWLSCACSFQEPADPSLARHGA